MCIKKIAHNMSVEISYKTALIVKIENSKFLATI